MRPAARGRPLVACHPEPPSALNHFSYRQLWRNVMRWFFLVVGVLAWLLALGVVWIF